MNNKGEKRWEVKRHVVAIGNFKNSTLNRTLFWGWGIPRTILNKNLEHGVDQWFVLKFCFLFLFIYLLLLLFYVTGPSVFVVGGSAVLLSHWHLCIRYFFGYWSSSLCVRCAESVGWLELFSFVVLYLVSC